MRLRTASNENYYLLHDPIGYSADQVAIVTSCCLLAAAGVEAGRPPDAQA
jgi:hypothetical protein